MKKRTKVGLSILAVLVILVVGGVSWQWQNIRALSSAMRYSKEELAVQIEEQKSNIDSVLKDYGLEGVMDFTFEEEEAIRRGEITFEEALEKLESRRQPQESDNEVTTEPTKDSTSSQGESVTGNGNSASGNSSTVVEEGECSQASSKVRVEQSVNKMYELKAKYLGELGKLERQARSEYAALTSEQKSKGGARTIINKYMNPGLSLQSTCDAEVEEVLASLKTFLKQQNESLEIIDVMRAAYEREKELKKAYYLSLVN